MRSRKFKIHFLFTNALNSYVIFARVCIFIVLIPFSMRNHLIDHCSSSKISKACSKSLKLRYHLNRIEELYHSLYSTMNYLQIHTEANEALVYRT